MTKPKMVWIIDQPSFSLAVARRLRKHKFAGAIIQVVAPTVWAYKPERVDTFAEYYDHMVTLFAFEQKYFAQKMAVSWLGHPVVDAIQPYENRQVERTLITLFPGSREGEVFRNARLQIEAAHKVIQAHPELTIAIVVSSTLASHVKAFLLQEAQNVLHDQWHMVDFRDRYDIMNRTKVAITKSGTVTLELGLFDVPFVCCYQISWLTRLWARYVMRVHQKYFALPNIFAGEMVFPEYIEKCSTDKIANAVLHILKHPPRNIKGLCYAQITAPRSFGDTIAHVCQHCDQKGLR